MENKPKKIFGLNRNVFFLGLVSLFNDFSSRMVASVLPAFVTIVLGAPPVFLGVMDGAANALASFWRIVSGWFSDKIHKRKSIAVFGYGLSILARSLLIFVGNIWQVFAIWMADRVGKGTRDAPRDALLAESSSNKDVGKSFGYQRAMDTLGAVLGASAAIVILKFTQDYRFIFFVAFLIGILAIVSFIFVRETGNSGEKSKKHKEKSQEDIPPKLSFSLKKFPGYFKVFILAIFIFGLGAMPLSLMLLKVGDIDESLMLIPVMFFVYSVSFTLFAIPFGKFSDKIGKRKIIAGGFLVAIIAYLIFANFSTLASIVAGFILFGMYSAMTDGIERAKTSRLVSNEALAQGEGFLGASVGVSSLLAGIIGGSIWTFVGSSAAFTYGAIMMTIGFVLFIYWNGFWHRHTKGDIL